MTARPVGAARHADAHGRRAGRGERAGPADQRTGPAGVEPVAVAGLGSRPPTATATQWSPSAGTSASPPPPDRRPRPAPRTSAPGPRPGPGPQDHRVGGRVEAGDAVVERRLEVGGAHGCTLGPSGDRTALVAPADCARGPRSSVMRPPWWRASSLLGTRCVAARSFPTTPARRVGSHRREAPGRMAAMSSATMPAYRIVDWEQPPRLVEAPVPEPAAGEVLVAVAANGLLPTSRWPRSPPRSATCSAGGCRSRSATRSPGTSPGSGAGVTGLSEGTRWRSCRPPRAARARLPPRPGQRVPQRARRPGLRPGRRARPVRRGPGSRAVVPLGGLDPVVAGPLTDAGATSHHAVAAVVPGWRRHDRGRDRRRWPRGVRRPAPPGADPGPRGRRRHQPRPPCAGARDWGPTTAVEDVAAATALIGGSAEVVLDIVGTDATIAAGLRAGGALRRVRPSWARRRLLRRAPWFGGLPGTPRCSRSRARRSPTSTQVVELAEAGRIPAPSIATRSTEWPRPTGDGGGTLTGRAVVLPA